MNCRIYLFVFCTELWFCVHYLFYLTLIYWKERQWKPVQNNGIGSRPINKTHFTSVSTCRLIMCDWSSRDPVRPTCKMFEQNVRSCRPARPFVEPKRCFGGSITIEFGLCIAATAKKSDSSHARELPVIVSQLFVYFSCMFLSEPTVSLFFKD